MSLLLTLRLLLLTALLHPSPARPVDRAPVPAQVPDHVPMTAAFWQPSDGESRLEFIPYEGFPRGILGIKAGDALLRGANFADGTIEFDVKPIGEELPGIHFRRRDAGTAEEFYLRPTPNCPAAQDCIQYAPITHGHRLWDMYPQYQAPAPVAAGAWNHVKLVISGRRMNVFLNREAAPSLAIPELAGDANEGGIELEGPAYFANLTIAPGAVEGLSPKAEPEPADPRFLRQWLLSPEFLLPLGATPAIPEVTAAWVPYRAERFGIVNLARAFAANRKPPAPVAAWLTTEIDSDRDQIRRVRFGWLRYAWVFVNGKPIFADKNTYYPEGGRKFPDGRLSIENSTFDLPLKKGSNRIMVATTGNFGKNSDIYGWGIAMRLDDLDGVCLPAPKRAAASSQP